MPIIISKIKVVIKPIRIKNNPVNDKAAGERVIELKQLMVVNDKVSKSQLEL
jgi:hypothetical protein